jgi:RHS repeat-associated protein
VLTRDDADGRVANYDSGGLTTLSYDDASRITAITDNLTAANSWTYGYDSLDRVTTAAKTGTTLGWSYDANGNRLSQTGSNASTYTVSGSSNRISSITGALARTYTYDAAGNTETYSNLTASYNNRGRMKSLQKASTTATYVYDALGHLVKQSGGPSGTVYYAYDEAGHLVGEYNSTGALIQETVWLGDIPVATIRPNGASVLFYYVHADHLNTPIRVTRPGDNKLMWSWYASPFGTDAANENPAAAGTFKYNLRFPGQIHDSHGGLMQNWNRDYDPVTGRYAQSDLIGLNGGVNTYAYVSGGPLTGIDPAGLETCVIVTTNSWGIRNHSALYMSQGDGRPFLFDPDGRYARSHGGGTLDIVEGDDVNLDEFVKLHNPDKTETVCKATSAEEESRLVNKIIGFKPPNLASCAVNVSNALWGSPYFPRVRPNTLLPGNLFRAAGGRP